MHSAFEPFTPDEARKRIRAILENGTVVWSAHALEEMQADGLTTVDCVNVLRAGAVDPAEFESGSWRYRVHTQRIWAVIAFRSHTELVVVTVWRARG